MRLMPRLTAVCRISFDSAMEPGEPNAPPSADAPYVSCETTREPKRRYSIFRTAASSCQPGTNVGGGKGTARGDEVVMLLAKICRELVNTTQGSRDTNANSHHLATIDHQLPCPRFAHTAPL